jgi:hypothetical protein
MGERGCLVTNNRSTAPFCVPTPLPNLYTYLRVVLSERKKFPVVQSNMCFGRGTWEGRLIRQVGRLSDGPLDSTAIFVESHQMYLPTDTNTHLPVNHHLRPYLFEGMLEEFPCMRFLCMDDRMDHSSLQSREIMDRQ